MSTAKSILKAGAVIVVCLFVAITAGSGNGGNGDALPKTNVLPVGDGVDGTGVASAIMTGMQPIIKSSAGAVDILGKLAYDPKPSFFDTWGMALTTLCVVGMVIGIPGAVVALWIVDRGGWVVKALHALERRGAK